jgi:hypothetical protein
MCFEGGTSRGGGLVSTFHEQQAQRSGPGARSRMRWLLVGAVMVAIIVAIVLLVAYGGGGSGGPGY